MRFGIDGRELEIDLTAKNAAALRKVFDVYIRHGRRVGGRRVRTSGSAAPSSPPASGGTVDAKVARQWAGKHGYTVSARGRIPADVLAGVPGGPGLNAVHTSRRSTFSRFAAHIRPSIRLRDRAIPEATECCEAAGRRRRDRRPGCRYRRRGGWSDGMRRCERSPPDIRLVQPFGGDPVRCIEDGRHCRVFGSARRSAAADMLDVLSRQRSSTATTDGPRAGQAGPERRAAVPWSRGRRASPPPSRTTPRRR